MATLAAEQKAGRWTLKMSSLRRLHIYFHHVNIVSFWIEKKNGRACKSEKKSMCCNEMTQFGRRHNLACLVLPPLSNFYFLFNRSVWLISGFILPFLEMDVWSKHGSLYPDIQPYHVARGKILTSSL